MLTVEEALDAILSRVSVLGTERVDVLGSLGRVLAQVVVSRREIPPWPNSSMDGYAVRAEVTGQSLRSRNAVVAYCIGVIVFVPFPLLAAFFVLPGLIWLSLFGLAVPVALVEGLGIRASLARALRLARADFIHVLGGLATLAIVVFLTQAGLFFVLREFAENTRVAAATLASIVVSPLVFLGAALLYVDQEARLGSSDA